MRVAALYDVHGNLPALEAVLQAVRAERIDEIVVGGDVIPGPMSRECLDILLNLELPVRFIRGNGEREVLAIRAGQQSGSVPELFRDVMRWTAAQLEAKHERAIAAWRATLRLDMQPLGATLFCHATPRNDTEIFTQLTPADSLRPIFDGQDADVVVCGHTHMQFDRMIGSTRVVNAGSVGMPFQEPGAYWLLLGSEIELRRTAYDLNAAADRIRATRYPQAEDFADRSVLHPPAEAEMLAAFTRADLSKR